MSTLSEGSKKATFAIALVGALFAVHSQARAVSYDGEDRSFMAFNHSSAAITHLYATDIRRPDWGVDLLGTSVLGPGRNYVTRPPIDRGYCLFDVAATFSDGTADIITRVNLCTALGLEFTDEGHRVLR
jgi:hypothetical protein